MTLPAKTPPAGDIMEAEQKIEEQAPPQLPAVADHHGKIAAAEPKPRKPSPSLRNVATALAAVTAEVGIVAKLGHNKFHNYKYAAMQDVLQKIAPLIGKHGLIIMQTEVPDGRKFIDDGRAIAVEYEFTVAHSSGEVWPDRPRQTGLCKCRDSKGGFDDKSFNKCHTAARKYFLLSLFQVATGEEDDADRERTGDAGRAPKPGPNVMNAPPYDPETGEITEPPPETAPDAADDAPPPAAELPATQGGGASLSIEDMAREAAMHGEKVFRGFYRLRSGAEQARINKIGDELRGLMEESK